MQSIRTRQSYLFSCVAFHEHSSISVIPKVGNVVITARKRSLRRLCFYRCVSVHGGHAWLGGVHGRGACMAGGMHGGGMHSRGVHGRGRCAWQGACVAGSGACVAGGHVWQEGMHGRGMHGGGNCMAGAMHGGGYVWQGCAWWGGMHEYTIELSIFFSKLIIKEVGPQCNFVPSVFNKNGTEITFLHF